MPFASAGALLRSLVEQRRWDDALDALDQATAIALGDNFAFANRAQFTIEAW